jgi:hypothetical protein
MRRPPVLLALVCLLLLAIPPVVLRAAITVNELYVGTTSANAAATYTSDEGGGTGPLVPSVGESPFEIASGSLLLCGVVWSSGISIGTMSLVHDGDTMTSPATTTFSSGTYAISLHYVAGPQSSSHVVLTPSGSPNGVGLACYEVTGVDTGDPVIQFKSGTSTGTSHTVTMDAPRTSDSVLFHWLGNEGLPSFPPPEYSGVGSGLSYSSPNSRGKMQWDINGTDITPTITSSSNVIAANHAIELAMATATGVTPQMLMLGVGER